MCASVQAVCLHASSAQWRRLPRTRHSLLCHPPPLTGQKPKLAKPTVKAVSLRITGCGASDVAVERIEVVAGLARVVSNEAGDTRDYGIPSAVKLQVLAPNASEAVGACTWTVPSRKNTRPGAIRTLAFPRCATCVRCLRHESINFKCGATYRLRALANKRGGKLRSSDWSQELEWKADCTGDAGVKCYV
jgi:hypothetical protein